MAANFTAEHFKDKNIPFNPNAKEISYYIPNQELTIENFIMRALTIHFMKMKELFGFIQHLSMERLKFLDSIDDFDIHGVFHASQRMIFLLKKRNEVKN